MTSSLADKTCTPCRGGVPPMSPEEAKQHASPAPGWELAENETRIKRSFRFGDFKQTLDFVNTVGALAEDEGHHPDICFGWGYCAVELFTHKIKGLHENDFIMAAKIDRLAAD